MKMFQNLKPSHKMIYKMNHGYKQVLMHKQESKFCENKFQNFKPSHKMIYKMNQG